MCVHKIYASSAVITLCLGSVLEHFIVVNSELFLLYREMVVEFGEESSFQSVHFETSDASDVGVV